MRTTLLIRIFILQVVHSAVKNMAKVSKKIIKGMKKYSRCKARQEKTGEGEVNFYQLRQLRRRVLTF